MVPAVNPDPVDQGQFCVNSRNLADTRRLGFALAAVLQTGDLVCIDGSLGAGKSELCRAILRARFDDDALEVPSPSYTLVNVYDHPLGEIWHADLYRIGDESELDEIGLEDAVANALVLLEWPERWSELPVRRLEIGIELLGADERIFTLKPFGAGWTALMLALKAMK